MKQLNATKAGAKFQVDVMDSIQNKNLSQDLMGVDKSNILDIDSKNTHNSFYTKKKDSTELFLTKNEKMPGIRPASAIRGDIFITTENKITDLKNYGPVQGQMKFPDSNSSQFMKGIDSNIKYALFYKLDSFYHEDLEGLKNFYLSKNKDLNWFENFVSKYSNQTHISNMTKESFIDLFCFMELGFAWDLVGFKPIKSFISKVGDTLEYKEVDLTSTLTNDTIRVELKTTSDGYVYIYFYQGSDCIYILSQRKSIANCSFINKKYLRVINTVNESIYL